MIGSHIKHDVNEGDSRCYPWNMLRELYRSDRAFIAARSALRTKVGYVGASYVEHYYHLICSEYTNLKHSIESLEFELEATEIAIIERRNQWFILCAEAKAQEALNSWHSTATNTNQAAKRLANSAHAIDAEKLESFPADISQHKEFMWFYIKRIHTLIDGVALEVKRIACLLEELDHEALFLLKQLDTFQENVSSTIARVKQLHAAKPEQLIEGHASNNHEEYTLLDWQTTSVVSELEVNPMVNAKQEQPSQNQQQAVDIDFDFDFI